MGFRRLTPTDLVEIRATPFGPWKGDAALAPQSWQSVCQMGAPTHVGTHPAPAVNGPERVRIDARRLGQFDVDGPPPVATRGIVRPQVALVRPAVLTTGFKLDGITGWDLTPR